MSRRRKVEDKPRARQPRQKRDRPEPSDDGGLWLIRATSRNDAARILNECKDRPYWLSIPHEDSDGVEPVAGFHPCSFFRKRGRVYYGFLIRDHREAVVMRWENARRELTDRVQSLRG